jgi:hypothetical protein
MRVQVYAYIPIILLEIVVSRSSIENSHKQSSILDWFVHLYMIARAIEEEVGSDDFVNFLLEIIYQVSDVLV